MDKKFGGELNNVCVGGSVGVGVELWVWHMGCEVACHMLCLEDKKLDAI